ncbi:transcription elongation factor A2 [Rhinolophus ferrumequinum]|uniref:Transcription elongation factor A2 n=1 Tax=Rhinolophus ferrumequinum TaxID=59479 RepID=A0A7J7S9T6_RHIFE|nr:transcription elongation factor A2 [Rhinolophus ferrumequinum]
MKYKNRVRSRISNLKDAKNPDLRRNVLCGAITPQQIAVMTSEDMASDELKEIRKAMTKEAIREHQMARTGGTQTDLFTCGKCRKKNCTYTQVGQPSSQDPCPQGCTQGRTLAPSSAGWGLLSHAWTHAACMVPGLGSKPGVMGHFGTSPLAQDPRYPSEQHLAVVPACRWALKLGDLAWPCVEGHRGVLLLAGGWVWCAA